MKNSKLTLSALLAGASLLGAPGLHAAGSNEHAGGHDHSQHGGHAADSSKGGAVMTSHDGMTALYKHLGEMEAGFTAGKLETIHDHAEAMGASVKDLDKDTSLTAEKKKRVRGYVKNIIRLADKVHHSADGKKLDQARKDFAKLQAQVDLLDKQFAHSHKPGAPTAPAAPTAAPTTPAKPGATHEHKPGDGHNNEGK